MMDCDLQKMTTDDCKSLTIFYSYTRGRDGYTYHFLCVVSASKTNAWLPLMAQPKHFTSQSHCWRYTLIPKQATLGE